MSIEGSQTCVSLNSRLESNKEEEEVSLSCGLHRAIACPDQPRASNEAQDLAPCPVGAYIYLGFQI